MSATSVAPVRCDMFLTLPTGGGVYVLRLRGGNYYVGYTTSFMNRIRSHFEGEGAAWTKLHPPCAIEALYPGGDVSDEHIITIETMKKYHWENVRGAEWVTIELSVPKPFAPAFSCYRCGSPNHSGKDCKGKGKATNESVTTAGKDDDADLPVVRRPGKNHKRFRITDDDETMMGKAATGEECDPPVQARVAPQKKPRYSPCEQCGNTKHLLRDCPYNQSDWSDDGDDSCYICGETDHWSSKCPNKRAWGKKEK
jgi:predicted GIY-YIG superfamily endonuclease